jgi:hypothetical protein
MEDLKPDEVDEVGIELVEEPAELEDFVFVRIRLIV